MNLTTEILLGRVQYAKQHFFNWVVQWAASYDPMPKLPWYFIFKASSSDLFLSEIQKRAVPLKAMDEVIGYVSQSFGETCSSNTDQQMNNQFFKRTFECLKYQDNAFMKGFCHLATIYQQLLTLEELLKPVTLIDEQYFKPLSLVQQMFVSITSELRFVEYCKETLDHYSQRWQLANEVFVRAQENNSLSISLLGNQLEHYQVQFSNCLTALVGELEKSYRLFPDDRIGVSFLGWFRLRALTPWQQLMNNVSQVVLGRDAIIESGRDRLAIDPGIAKSLISIYETKNLKLTTSLVDKEQGYIRLIDKTSSVVKSQLHALEKQLQVQTQMGIRPILQKYLQDPISLSSVFRLFPKPKEMAPRKIVQTVTHSDDEFSLNYTSLNEK